MSALDEQIGGNHYRTLKIQPAEFVHGLNLPYLEGSAVYYIVRWREKGGLKDIDKAIHTLNILKELEMNAQIAAAQNAVVLDTTEDERKQE